MKRLRSINRFKRLRFLRSNWLFYFRCCRHFYFNLRFYLYFNCTHLLAYFFLFFSILFRCLALFWIFYIFNKFNWKDSLHFYFKLDLVNLWFWVWSLNRKINSTNIALFTRWFCLSLNYLLFHKFLANVIYWWNVILVGIVTF